MVTRISLEPAAPAPAGGQDDDETASAAATGAAVRWRSLAHRWWSGRVWLIVLLLLGLGMPGAAATPPGPASAAPPGQAPPPGPAPRITPLAYGFQGEFFHTASRPDAIAAIKEAGFGWAKQQVRWEDYEIQPSECAPSGSNCLEAALGGRHLYLRRDRVGFLDAVIDDLSGAGLRVLLSVVRAPAFHAAAGGHAPADPERLRDFLVFLAGRYKGKVHAIEPWNEQNLSWEWGGSRLWPNAPAAPPQGVVEFVALQRAAYEGIKQADPSIVVVLPALTPTGLGECWLDPQARSHGFCLEHVQAAIDDRLYLDFLYQVNGGEIKRYYDVVGVHPSGYNNPPDDWMDKKSVSTDTFKGHGSFYIKRYQQLREVQLKHGDTKPMWFTEVGWSVAPRPVAGYEYGRDNTEEVRGAYIARLLEQVHLDAPYVTNVFLWNLNFRSIVPGTDEKYGFGLVNSDGSRTPGYLCAADFVLSGNKITRPECRLQPAAGASVAAATSFPAATEPPTATPPAATPTATTTATAPPTVTATPTSTATPLPSLTPALASTATSPAGSREAPATASGSVTAIATSTLPPITAPTTTVTPAATPGATATAVSPSPPVLAAATPLPPPQPAPDTPLAAAGQAMPVPRPSLDSAGAFAAAAPGQREHIVVKGDTLYSLARRHNTTVEALVAANGLGSREAVLPIGRRLIIPPVSVTPTSTPVTPSPGQREHIVVKGDTLYSLARRHNTTVEALVAANGLGSRDAVLLIGRRLVIP